MFPEIDLYQSLYYSGLLSYIKMLRIRNFL